MIGEYDFGDIFFPDPGDDEIVDPTLDPFPGYSAPLFIVFVFVMSITIMNLMVGLAVDDIKQIQENAELEKLSMHVGNHYFLLEQSQPFSGKTGIGAGAVLPRLTVGPQQKISQRLQCTDRENHEAREQVQVEGHAEQGEHLV